MRARARTSLQSRARHRRSISATDRMNRSPSTCRPNAALKSRAPLPKRLRRRRPHGVHTFDSPANDRAARCASISRVARFAASRCERRAQARSRRFASIRVDSPDSRQSGSPTVEQRASPPPIDGRRRHRRSRVRSRLEHRARNRNRPVDAPNAPRRVERADTGASAAHARRFPTPNPRHRAEAELYSPLPPRDTPLERRLRRTRAHRPLGGPSVRARTAHRRTAA